MRPYPLPVRMLIWAALWFVCALPWVLLFRMFFGE